MSFCPVFIVPDSHAGSGKGFFLKRSFYGNKSNLPEYFPVLNSSKHWVHPNGEDGVPEQILQQGTYDISIREIAPSNFKEIILSRAFKSQYDDCIDRSTQLQEKIRNSWSYYCSLVLCFR